MATDQTKKCPECKRLYTVFAFFFGDQSICPACRKKVPEDRKKPLFWSIV